MSDRLIVHLHPDMQPLCQKFIDQCRDAGINAFVTQTYRSDEEQDADYAKGRTAPGRIITNARAGQSPHNITLDDGTPAACAFDFAIQVAGGQLDWDAQHPQWIQAIRIGQSLGMVSGSSWRMKDNPHFELANWKDYL